MTELSPNYLISADKSLLQIDWIISALRSTYWANGRPPETIRASIVSSRCYGAFLKSDSAQVGFARVVSDEATFSWLCDVIVDPSHRGRGLGKLLVTTVTNDPVLKSTSILLATRDAQGLYERYGFVRREMMRRPGTFENTSRQR